MTTYYRTDNGGIVNNHDIARAYHNSDKSVSFKEFSRNWLRSKGAYKDETICTDDLIKAGQIREAISYFNNLTGCGVDRAKNAVYAMKAAFGC